MSALRAARKSKHRQRSERSERAHSDSIRRPSRPMSVPHGQRPHGFAFNDDHKDGDTVFTDDDAETESVGDYNVMMMEEEKRSELGDHTEHSRSSSLRPMRPPSRSSKRSKSPTPNPMRSRRRKAKHETPSLSLSATSSVNLGYHHDHQLSSSLDLSGLESAPSEMTRADSMATECIICMDRDKNVAFLPCGHYIACEECATLLRHDIGTCAICSAGIEAVIKIFE